MRSVSLKTVDLARLKSSEMFIEIEEEKKKKDQSFVQRFCSNDNMRCAQMLWCRSNRLAMRMTWRFDLNSIRQHEKIDHVKVVTAYKRKAQKIQSVNSSELNDSISEGLTNWKQILLTQVKLNMTEMKSEKYDHWLFFKFFKIAREFRLTSKRAKRMICDDALTLQEKNLLLKMLFNREVTMIWNFSEMKKIKDIVSFLQQIRMISHDAWQTLNFPVSKTLHQIIIDMLKNWIKHDILKSCHDLYRNLWFLIKKKFNQYHMINAAMNMNKIIIRDVNLFSDVNEFFKEFVDMIIIFLIDLFSEYDQITLTKIYQDLTAFMTSLRLLRQTTLLQDVINFVAQFVRIIIKILKNLLEICRCFLDDIEVKKSKTIYDNAEIASEVHQFVLKHIKNLDFVFLNFELIDCIISDEKLQFCMSSIKIVKFVCDFHDRRSEDFKIIKILE